MWVFFFFKAKKVLIGIKYIFRDINISLNTVYIKCLALRNPDSLESLINKEINLRAIFLHVSFL